MRLDRVKIHLTDEPFEINVKRFYFPCEIKSQCPECGAHASRDFSNNYLSYPTVGKPENVYFWCDCGHEWEPQIILRLTVESC